MNIRDLEYLVALAETKSFRKASEKCFVSQPGLSGQIKKLEEELGVRLLERNHRRILFNPVGKAVVQCDIRVLTAVHELEKVAKSFENPMQGSLNLGIIPTLAPYLVPLIIGPMKEAYPELELYLHEIQTESLLKQLEDGQLDLGILGFPVEGGGLNKIPLFEEEFLLAVSPTHPLGSKRQVRLEDLEGEDVLLLRDGHCFRDQALAICEQTKAHQNTCFQANSIEILRQMVAYGRGITLLPQLSVRKEYRQMNSLIRYIRFQNPPPKRLIGMIFRPSSSRRSGFQAMGKLITKIAIENGMDVL